MIQHESPEAESGKSRRPFRDRIGSALRKVGIGLCLVSLLLGSVAVASFWFPLGSGYFGEGRIYDETLESLNEGLRETLPAGHTLPSSRAEIHRQNALFGLIVSSVLFTVGLLLYVRNRRPSQPKTTNPQ